MKNIKRWLAALLIIVLTLNTWTGSAWAEKEAEPVERLQIEENVESETATTENVDKEEMGKNASTEKEEELQTDGIDNIKKFEQEATSAVDTVEMESEKKSLDVYSEKGEQVEVYSGEAVPAFLQDASFQSMTQKIFGTNSTVSNDSIVYVSGANNNKEGQGNKGCYTYPFESLSEAMSQTGRAAVYVLVDAEKANAQYKAAGYGIEVTDYQGLDKGNNFDDWINAQRYPAIVVSENTDKAYLRMDQQGWSLKKNIGFYGIDLKLTNGLNPVELYCNGNTVVFGGEGKNNFQVKQTSNDYYPVLFGGSHTETVENTDLTVNSGTWSQIYSAGSYNESGTLSAVTGTANLTVNGKIDSVEGCSVINGYKAGSVNTAYYESAFIMGGAAGSTSNNAMVNTIHTEIKNINDANISVAITNGAMQSAWEEGDVPTLEVKNCQNITVQRGVGLMKDTYCYIEDSQITSFSLLPRVDAINIEANSCTYIQANNTVFNSFLGERSNNHSETSIARKEDWKFTACTFSNRFWVSPIGTIITKQDITFDNCTFKVGCDVDFPSTASNIPGSITFEGKTQTVKVVEASQKITEENVIPVVNNVARTYHLNQVILDLSAVQGKILIGSTTENSEILFTQKNAEYTMPEFDGNAIVQMAEGVNLIVNQLNGNSTIKVKNSEAYAKDMFSSIEIRQANLVGTEVTAAKDCSYKISTKLLTTKGYFYLAEKEINLGAESYIYVNSQQENYDETQAEGTTEKPYKTLEEAFQKVSENRYNIILLEDYTIEAGKDFPKLTEEQKKQLSDNNHVLRISGKDETSAYKSGIIFAGSNRGVNLYTDTEFDNLTFTNSVDGTNTLYVNGNYLKMGENISTLKWSNENLEKKYICLNGSSAQGGVVNKIDLEILSGYWIQIFDGRTSTTVGNNDTNQSSTEVKEKIAISGTASFYELNLNNTVNGNTEVTVADKNSYHPDSTTISINGTYNGRFNGEFHPETRLNCTSVTPTANGYFTASFQSTNAFRPNYSSFIGGNFKEGGKIDYIGVMHRYSVRNDTNIFNKELVVNMQTPEALSIGQTVIGQDTENLRLNINKYNKIFSVNGPDNSLPKNVVLDFHNGNYSINAAKNLGAIHVSADATLAIQQDAVCSALELEQNAKVQCMGKLSLGLDNENDAKLSIASEAQLIVRDIFQLYGNLKGTESENVAGILSLQCKASDGYGDSCKITGNAEGYVYVDTTEQYEESTSKGQRIYLTNANVEKHLIVYNTEQDDDMQSVLKNDNPSFFLYGHSEPHNYIYLDGTDGDNSNSGKKAAYPVKTLEKAYELVPEDGTIVIIGGTTINSWPKSGNQSVHITSYDTNPYLEEGVKRDYTDQIVQMQGDLCLVGNVYLECLNVQVPSSVQATLYPDGYELSIGVEKNDMKYSSDKNFTNTGILNIVGWHENYYNAGGNYTKIKIHAGTINVLSPVYDKNIFLSCDKAGKNLEEISVDGGTIAVLRLFQQMNVFGNINYYLSGGKINRIDIISPFYDRCADTMVNNFYISDTFRFNNLNLQHRGSYNVSFDNWKPTWEESEKHGFIDVSDPYSVTRGKDREINITIKNSNVESIACGGQTNEATKHTDNITVNLLENASITELYGGAVKGASNGCTTKDMNINILSDSASIGQYYASKDGINSKAEKVVFTVKTGTFYALTGLNGEISELHIESKENAPSSVALDKNVKDKIVDVNVDSGNALYLPSNSVIKGEYHGSSVENSPSLLYIANGATVKLAGAVTGYSKLLAGKVTEDVITEVEGGFKNGLKVNTDDAGNVGNDDALYLPDDYSQVLTVPTNASLYWSIPDSEDTVWRNHVYVGGDNAAEGNDGTFVRPVKTLAEAYKKAAERYNTLIEKQTDTSIDDEETKNQITSSIQEGITIIVNGTVALGELEATETDAEILKSIKNNIPVISIQSGIESGSIQFVSDNNQYILPMDTKIDDVDLKSETSVRSAIYGNGHRLQIGEKITTNSSSRTPIDLYGGALQKDISMVDLIVEGGTFDQVYGGNANNNITGNIQLYLGGKADINTVYGGSNTGEVSGNITITISDEVNIGTFYGGGNKAPSSGDINIDFVSGTIRRMYGGGAQNTAIANRAEVKIGVTDAIVSGRKAFVENLYRGAGYMAGYTSNDGVKTILGKNAVLGTESNQESTQFCAGGYSGNVAKTQLEIDGAVVYGNLYAGGWGEVNSNSYGNVESGGTYITFINGTVYGNVFGGGNNGIVDGTSVVNISGGNIADSIYGGGNAAGVKNSELNIKDVVKTLNIYGGSYNIVSNSKNNQESAQITLDGIQAQDVDGQKNVFGGSNRSGDITGKISVKVQSGIFHSNIYGGGNQAALSTTPQVTVADGATLTGNIFGGGKGELKSTNGFARAMLRIFTASDLVDANVPSTNVTINGTVNGDVFGGGEYATVGTSDETAPEDVLAQTVSKVTINGTVNGKVYGGGKGEKGKDYAAINGSTEVILGTNGHVTTSNHAENASTGVVFGGGQNAPVAGNTRVNVQEGTYSTIFGGNDVSGEIQGQTIVNITGGQTAHVYGAGRDAAYSGSGASVIVNAGQNTQTSDADPIIVSEVYGGGYGEGAVTDQAKVEIQNGRILTAYAGGNAAETKNTVIKVTGGDVTTAFGGGNAATVTGSSTITVDTTDDIQHVNTVFAGNNKAAMAIQPTFDFEDGKIGTVYGGGNEGVMTYLNGHQGLDYHFDFPNIEIGTVFAGCNNTTEQTADVQLTLVSGTYGTVYGGNNQNGNMNQTKVIVDASTDRARSLNVTNIYGGGNQADALNTAVGINHGKVENVYGGGNAATVTESVAITTGDDQQADGTDASAQITNLYCGNNQAEMAIAPTIDLEDAAITNFYGGGNQGAMTSENGLTYVFNSDDLTIDTIYGGGNEAGVTSSTTLNIQKGQYTTIYGGSNSQGTVNEAVINVKDNVGVQNGTDLSGQIFGGGRGQATKVQTATVNLQNGVIAGNVYGGSGFGQVGHAIVSAKEDTKDSDAKVQVLGNIFGAGYGVSSGVEMTDVQVALKLNITDKDDAQADVKVTESLKSTEDKSGESLAKAAWQNAKTYKDGSYIAGNVYGGGDMGQVGQGYINNSTNTAVIEQGGTTSVTIESGYIHGNIFGGGNGQPGGIDEYGHQITEYTVYMGTVFGTSKVRMTGGYVNGNIFGCGQQSRTYAAADQDADGDKDASMVIISTAESDTQQPVLIGGSIFGGGNKGNGVAQNASVATTYGDTHVTLHGKKNAYTPIYLLSTGTTGGGVYGDGNLCLVSGKKYVTLENFSCGVGSDVSLLKTFYSLQRADVVDLIASRIVLKGAVDLVAENADDTMYSINRVGQLNLKDSSTIKVTKTVNLLGELTSDEQPDRQFIDRGNNTGNASITGNNYTANGGQEPDEPLKTDEVTHYIQAYNAYMANGTKDNQFKSMNVVCVANGGYLEIKKSASAYGPVTGLFTLQLVNANPGEGGGFVYADIMGKKLTDDNGVDKYVTGNFICVTKQADDSNNYMIAYHNVGGQLTGDAYAYYVWYLKGNKYNYDVDLTAYIGTKDTDFTKSVSLALEPNQVFVLTAINQDKRVNGLDLEKVYQNTWDSSSDVDKASEKMSVEVSLVTNQKAGNGVSSTERKIGYLGYQTVSDTDPSAEMKKDSTGNMIWGIWRSDGNGGWKFQACKDDANSFKVVDGDALATIGNDVVGAQLKFTLHKGTGMTTEFRNLPFELKIVEVDQTNYEEAVSNPLKSIEEDSCIRLTTNLNLSAIRLVPTQAAYMSSGRMFAGVASSANVNITQTSAFTAQFVTKYIPSAFNTGSQNQITETLVTSYTDIYLVDPNGVGYTVEDQTDGSVKILNLTNTSNPDVKTYEISKVYESGSGEDIYEVSYLDDKNHVMSDSDGQPMTYTCQAVTRNSDFTLPKGTMITLLASLDENNPTYWYYYCTEEKSSIDLSDFKKMNTANTSTRTQSGESVYDTIFTTSSSRVTENMIFVFDFSEVAAVEWENLSSMEGHVMLKHTYQGSKYPADIMDYVASESQSDETGISYTYTREMPRQTDSFKISANSDGIEQFTLHNRDGQTTYGQKEQMTYQLNIIPDTSVTNTQYDEREYAVILTLRKKGQQSEIAFPEGTTFTYHGEKLSAGKDNKYVIVPVDTVGSHEVEIASVLYGFDPGEYDLVAKLYSTTQEGYYNSIPVASNVSDQTTAAFTVVQDPVYALKVEEKRADSSKSENRREKNHFIQAGESFDFAVTANGGEPKDAVDIQAYRYVEGAYHMISMDELFEQTPNLHTGVAQSWQPVVKAGVAKGTYRLAFMYHDKVEYWDFMTIQ